MCHLASILLSSGMLPCALAQGLSPLPIDGVVGASALAESSPIQFSPDGKSLVYTVTANHRGQRGKREDFFLTGVPADAQGGDIFIVSVEDRTSTRVTDGKGDNWLSTWSPDGRYLAFLSDRDGSGQARLWTWDAANGGLRMVSAGNVRTNQLHWTPARRFALVGGL